jgi:hypothetical protein
MKFFTVVSSGCCYCLLWLAATATMDRLRAMQNQRFIRKTIPHEFQVWDAFLRPADVLFAVALHAVRCC